MGFPVKLGHFWHLDKTTKDLSRSVGIQMEKERQVLHRIIGLREELQQRNALQVTRRCCFAVVTRFRGYQLIFIETCLREVTELPSSSAPIGETRVDALLPLSMVSINVSRTLLRRTCKAKVEGCKISLKRD